MRQGEMTALVTATGTSTYFGKTSKLVQEAKSVSHLQHAIIKIGDYLIKIAIIIVLVVVLIASIRGSDIFDTLQFALILLVASVPTAMPAVISVTLAVGAEKLAGMKAIVTKLESIEEAAGMDILCVDKTGTITKNEISIAEIETFGAHSAEEVIVLAGVASRREDNDPLETAIFNELEHLSMAARLGEYSVIHYSPFDPVSKRTEASAFKAKTKELLVTTKGAPQVIGSLSASSSQDAEKLKSAVEAFAKKGYRSLAVAAGPAGSKPALIGLIAMHDPPREDSMQTLEKAKGMGINVKMITGDHVAIAREIAGEVGIGPVVLSAGDLKDSPERDAMIEKADAFAEVFPEHKYEIVKALQGLNHIVGMTGDGVNDAPALKQAEVGIAVSSATDAARAASDLVLTTPGLAVIIEAVSQSRKIFERMNSYAVYRIAETIRVLLLLSFSILLFNFYPLTVLMLVLLALLNDFPIMMIAYDHAKMQEKPIRWNMVNVLRLSSFLGIMGLISSFSLLAIGMYLLHLSDRSLQVLMFLKLIVAGHMTLYLARTGNEHFWSKPLPAMKMFSVVETTQIVATLLVISGLILPSIPFALVLLVWLYSFAFFIINDFAKVAFLRRYAVA